MALCIYADNNDFNNNLITADYSAFEIRDIGSDIFTKIVDYLPLANRLILVNFLRENNIRCYSLCYDNIIYSSGYPLVMNGCISSNIKKCLLSLYNDMYLQEFDLRLWFHMLPNIYKLHSSNFPFDIVG
jgi:hypothetical protein